MATVQFIPFETRRNNPITLHDLIRLDGVPQFNLFIRHVADNCENVPAKLSSAPSNGAGGGWVSAAINISTLPG
jgi:hypothetical protein